MTTLTPEGEGLRRAIKWISAHLDEKNEAPLQKLIQEAVLRYDLSPKDTEFLVKFYKESRQGVAT